jgi:hypothetical protein
MSKVETVSPIQEATAGSIIRSIGGRFRTPIGLLRSDLAIHAAIQQVERIEMTGPVILSAIVVVPIAVVSTGVIKLRREMSVETGTAASPGSAAGAAAVLKTGWVIAVSAAIPAVGRAHLADPSRAHAPTPQATEASPVPVRAALEVRRRGPVLPAGPVVEADRVEAAAGAGD